eukprot:Em0006g274a
MYQKKSSEICLKERITIFQKDEQRKAGHMGVKRTLKRINERLRWPGMVKDVTNMVARCDICQRANRKLVHTAPELHPVPVKSPWHHIGIDFVGPILESKSGNLYILTIFMRMGLPKVITTDNGTEFKNDLNKHLMELLGIEQRFTTAYHPQANGLVERFNQTLQTMVVKLCASKKDNWDMVLDGCIFAYNTSCHESALYTPFKIMFGRKATLPIDLKMEQVEAVVNHGLFFQDNVLDIKEITKQRCSVVKQVKENIEKAQIKQKQNYDRRHTNPKAYQIGTKILKNDFTRKKRKGGKMDCRYVGPFVITKSLGKGLYSLASVESPKKVTKSVNGVHLKPYLSPTSSQCHFDKDENRSNVDGPVEDDALVFLSIWIVLAERMVLKETVVKEMRVLKEILVLKVIMVLGMMVTEMMVLEMMVTEMMVLEMMVLKEMMILKEIYEETMV